MSPRGEADGRDADGRREPSRHLTPFFGGYRMAEIDRQLCLAFHLRPLGVAAGCSPYVGRRRSARSSGGLRIGELCALRIGQVRLHDSLGTRLHIPDSKTETGIRDVQMSPDLVEAVVEHLDRLRRSGAPTGPDDWLVPNSRGGRPSRRRAGKVVG